MQVYPPHLQVSQGNSEFGGSREEIQDSVVSYLGHHGIGLQPIENTSKENSV